MSDLVVVGEKETNGVKFNIDLSEGSLSELETRPLHILRSS